MTLEPTLHRLGRAAGDARSIRRGRYPQRLARRAAYRTTGGLTRKLLRLVGL